MNDPNGLLAGFPKEIAAGYNLYPYEIRKSAWAGYKSKKTDGFTAAIVGMPPASPFIASMSGAIRTSLKASGVKIVGEFAPDDPSNVPLQLQQFNEALSLKPDVIIYTPIAPEPSVGLAKAAFDAGIPLVAAQVPIDSEYAVSVTRNTPLAIAQVTAGTLRSIGGKGNVLRVDGIPGIPVSTFANPGHRCRPEELPGDQGGRVGHRLLPTGNGPGGGPEVPCDQPCRGCRRSSGRNDGRRHPQRL